MIDGLQSGYTDIIWHFTVNACHNFYCLYT